MDTQPIVWKASDAEVARSRTADFMARHGIDTYQDLVERSIAELEWFWEATIGYLGVPFSKPYHTLVDTTDGIQFPRWFSGGEINLSEVCVDRWAAQDPGGPRWWRSGRTASGGATASPSCWTWWNGRPAPWPWPAPPRATPWPATFR